jgi:VanZ family protein
MEEALLWMPAGFLCARAIDGRAARPMLAVVGLGAATAAEVARGLVGAPIVLGAVVAQTMGFAAGAALATLVAHGERRSVVLAPSAGVAAYALVVAYWAWRPFVLRPNPFDAIVRTSVDQLLPLATQAAHSDLAGVTDVLIGFLLYAGLGVLLARRPRSTPRSLLLAACLSLLTEAGQLFVAERFFDVTDIVIQCAGAAAGWLLVRAPGARPDA